MRIAFKTLGLMAALAFAPALHAEDEDTPPSRGDDKRYVGVGLFNDLLNVNAEMVTDWGNFVLRVGKFLDTEDGIAAHVAWRKALTADDNQTSGYYLGLFAGQVKGDAIAGEVKNRLGAGADLGYHWVNNETRKVLSVGLGSAEPFEEGEQKVNAEPYIFFNFSAAIGF